MPSAALNSNIGSYCAPGGIDLGAKVISPSVDKEYQWYTNAQNATPTNLLSSIGSVAAGTYYLFVSDTNACKSNVIDSVVVSESVKPTAEATSPSMVCYGSNVTIPANTTGTGLTLQWYSFNPNGSSSSTLSNSGVYSGVNTSSLSISNTAGQAQYLFYLSADNGTCSVNSNMVSIPVDTFVLVTLNPIDVTAVCSNCIATFSASSSVQNANLSWQVKNSSGTWMTIGNTGLDALMYSGVNTPDLQLLSSQDTMDGFQYRFVANNLCNNDTSSIATLFSLFALPVKLIDFKATLENKHVKINWTVNGNDEVSKFHLLGSNDGVNFYTIKSVLGLNTINSIQSYQEFDGQDFDGVKYYKLNVELKNGLLFHSSIASVRANESKLKLEIFPNPININSLGELKLICPYDFNGRVLIMDFSGKIIYNSDLDLLEGQYELNLSTLMMTAGVYNVLLQSEDMKLNENLKLVISN